MEESGGESTVVFALIVQNLPIGGGGGSNLPPPLPPLPSHTPHTHTQKPVGYVTINAKTTVHSSPDSSIPRGFICLALGDFTQFNSRLNIITNSTIINRGCRRIICTIYIHSTVGVHQVDFLCQELPIVTKWNIGKSTNINSREVGSRGE
jgi:hypothetical protein